MVKGPKVPTKFIWLLDEVEVKGIVRGQTDEDSFAIEPDENYRHLVSFFPGNNPLAWFENDPTFPACIHCETYPLLPDPNNPTKPYSHTNKFATTTDPQLLKKDTIATPLNKKNKDVPFTVTDPELGNASVLKIGDHIRIVGRWVIDHHPEDCDKNKFQGPRIVHCSEEHDIEQDDVDAEGGKICFRNIYKIDRCRHRGTLRVGPVHTELHPFHYDQITLVKDLKLSDIQEETVSVGAPLYEEQYVGHEQYPPNGIGLVSGNIFITEDGSNFHNFVTANAYIKAPPLPANSNFHPHKDLIGFKEEVIKLGKGLHHTQVRSLTIVKDGIKVIAKIIAPVMQYFDGIGIADINDPANDKSIFQAKYSVWWLARLIPVYSNNDPLEIIDLGSQAVGSETQFKVFIRNRGPDDLSISNVSVVNNTSVFRINTTTPKMVPAGSTISLDATFSPPNFSAAFEGTIVIDNNDPSHPQIFIPIKAKGYGFRPKIEASPLSLNFGNVKVGDTATQNISLRNVGTWLAYVDEITKSGVPDLSTNEDQFQFTSIPNTDIPPSTLQRIGVSYSPTQRGLAQAIVRIVTDGPRPYSRQEFSISLKGQGLAPKIELDPPSLDFGAVTPNNSTSLNLLIKNTGDADLVVANVIGDWMNGSFLLDPSLTFPLFSIPPETQSSIAIRFYAPTVPGQRSNTEWYIITDPPQPQYNPAAKFSLTGISAGPHIEVWPDIVDFYRVYSPTALRDVSISNRGTSDLRITSVRLNGDTEFLLTGLSRMPFTIAASQEQRFQVTFSSQQTGEYRADLDIANDDQSQPRVRRSIHAIRV